jgi:pimeloyl-ACP methyl ester carboxylesterase
MFRIVAALFLIVFAVPSAEAQTRLVGEDLRVPHEGGVEIFVRNKRPDGVARFGVDRIAIMMHGATYPATAFDLPLGGKSWMDYMAERGWDVYALDLPGYGRSTRPALMEQPAAESEPYMRGTEAVKALGAVVDFVRQRRGVERVNLVGWSWGSTLTATYSSQNPAKVARLALYAPPWERSTPSLVQVQGKIGGYRTVSRDQALDRWLTGVPEGAKAGLIPAGWYDQWAEATFATDPKGGGKTLRAPNGVVVDGLEFFGANPPKPYYDPSKIAAPVLLIVGEWDRDTPPYMAQALFPKLTGAPWKRMTLLSEATHTVVMEKNRMLLIRSVQQFLEEPPPAGAVD